MGNSYHCDRKPYSWPYSRQKKTGSSMFWGLEVEEEGSVILVEGLLDFAVLPLDFIMPVGVERARGGIVFLSLSQRNELLLRKC